MNLLFCGVCSLSVIFFVFVVVQCHRDEKRHRSKGSCLSRLPPGLDPVNFPLGRRYFMHLEKQMAEFLSHHRAAMGLALALLLLPGALKAQEQPVDSTQARADALSAASSDDQSTPSGDDQSIPPAVQKQLDAMKKRIEQLEAELDTRTPQGAPITSKATASVHVVTDQTAAAPAAVGGESALSQQTAPPRQGKPAPFSFADFTWLNGNSRIKEVLFDTKFFTPEIRADVDYVYDFHHPQDDTLGGSSEIFRANEFQVTQLGVGGDFHFDNVQARLMTQFGMYSQTTPRNDASPARGQWQLADAYRYVSEAYGGYHIDALDGINIQAGIFMSYIGLFSYYNFDNWAYQPSYVSSNTPWFFNGMRVQIFPNEHLKIEPWLINGWQSYGRFNHRPGVGGQILWRPNGRFSFVGNQYALGEDTLGVPGRVRYHTDDSVQYKYYENPSRFLDMAAFSFTGDMGCEHGGGVSCAGNSSKGPKQSFLGFMIYNRLWFHQDLYALTLGGGEINNPGRYLVLLPPINGATAASGTPYFTANPGDPFKAWDASATVDYMPSQYVTFRLEYNYRGANVPYFSGPGGITPPGGNTGPPGSVVPGFTPNLVKNENRVTGALLVMF